MLHKKIFSNLHKARHASSFAPENIFKEETISSTLINYNKLKPLFTTIEPPTHKAAILIPLCIVNGKTSLLYTLRTSHLRSHKGQVSFPGGKYDDDDKNLEYTALRETKEELGIDVTDIKVWGAGTTVGNRNTLILPVIGHITKKLDIKQFNVNLEEVEDVFTVSLEDLCNQSNHAYTQFRIGYSLPVFLGGPRRIWGITAVITDMFLKCLLPNTYNHKIKFTQTQENL